MFLWWIWGTRPTHVERWLSRQFMSTEWRTDRLRMRR